MESSHGKSPYTVITCAIFVLFNIIHFEKLLQGGLGWLGDEFEYVTGMFGLSTNFVCKFAKLGI